MTRQPAPLSVQFQLLVTPDRDNGGDDNHMIVIAPDAPTALKMVRDYYEMDVQGWSIIDDGLRGDCWIVDQFPVMDYSKPGIQEWSNFNRTFWKSDDWNGQSQPAPNNI